MTRFIQRLQTRARELGLSDAAVAERLGMTPARYTSYVKGRAERDAIALARLCRALRFAPNDLLGYRGPRITKLPPSEELRRIATAAESLTPKTRRVAVSIVAALAAHQKNWSANNNHSS
jgi:transcriptional regulator with XRE-family HTH domain